MSVYKILVPVTVWMDTSLTVEADDGEDAYEKAADRLNEGDIPYPELCRVCDTRFYMEEPDEADFSLQVIK